MTDPEKVLIVSPHPDDETLGAGGTLLQHQQRGDEIHCLLMTELAGNDNSSLRSDVPRLRRENAPNLERLLILPYAFFFHPYFALKRCLPALAAW